MAYRHILKTDLTYVKSANIKLMNRSCFDRKRFAVLLHEDWAARRTR